MSASAGTRCPRRSATDRLTATGPAPHRRGWRDGQWLRPAAEFVQRHRATLAARPLWLFSSGPLGTASTDPKGRPVLEAAEPKQFVEFRTLLGPRGLRAFFGGLDPGRLGGGERVVRATPVGRQLLPEGDFRDWPAIEAWAQDIARELSTEPAASN